MTIRDTIHALEAVGDARRAAPGLMEKRSLQVVQRLRFHITDVTCSPARSGAAAPDPLEQDCLHRIDIVFGGRRQVVYHRKKALNQEPGQAYFLPGNVPVEYRGLKHHQILTIRFRCEWLPGMDPLLDWPTREPAVLGPVDLAVWRPWLQADWKHNSNHLLQLQGQIILWMATLLPNLNALIRRHLETHARFEPIFVQVEKNLDAKLRVSDLAKTYGTCAPVFSNTFAAVTGLSPKAYINRRLNQEALRLLLNTNLKIKEIAEKLRFASEFYFSRFFRKMNGVPPAQYRQGFHRDQD